MITISLKPPEARLCRDAAKLAKSGLFLDHGPQTLPRGDWSDLAQWLGWLACDMEIERELSERKAAENLVMKIEAAIARHDKARAIVLAEVEPEPELEPATPAGCLF